MILIHGLPVGEGGQSRCGPKGRWGAKGKAKQVHALPWNLRVGSRGTLDAPTPDSRSCPSQLHTLAAALPSPHTGVFQLLGMSPECLQSSGRPVAIGARRAVPSRGPICCEIADLPNGQALARLTE